MGKQPKDSRSKKNLINESDQSKMFKNISEIKQKAESKNTKVKKDKENKDKGNNK